jgi:hypothetical protein
VQSGIVGIWARCFPALGREHCRLSVGGYRRRRDYSHLALPGSGVAGQYRSLSKRLMNWGLGKIDHVTCRCLELGFGSLLQIKLTRSKKLRVRQSCRLFCCSDRTCSCDPASRFGPEDRWFAVEGVHALARFGNGLVYDDELGKTWNQEDAAFLQLVITDVASVSMTSLTSCFLPRAQQRFSRSASSSAPPFCLLC